MEIKANANKFTELGSSKWPPFDYAEALALLELTLYSCNPICGHLAESHCFSGIEEESVFAL